MDKIFDKGFEWFKKVEHANNRIIEKAKELGNVSSSQMRDAIEPQPRLEGPYFQMWGPGIRKAGSLVGLGAVAILLWKLGGKIVPRLPSHLDPADKRCVLLFGQMRDPITRQIVMDLYRRGFTVFVCSEHVFSQNDDDGLFHITHEDLPRMVKYLEENSAQLTSILIIPNSAYYPSGLVTTLSSTVITAELEQNVFTHVRALIKILPHFKNRLQIIFLSPSLPKHFAVPHHSPEYLVAGLISSFYEALRSEVPQASIYLCHLGVLKIAGSPSNYKYLSMSGSGINKSLLMPLYRLITSNNSWWFSFWEVFGGHQRFYGKGSMLGYYFGRWIPLSFLKLL